MSNHIELVLEHFDIEQQEVARALNVHASMITRWKNGESRFNVDSKSMEPFVNFILAQVKQQDIAWFRACFAEAGLDYLFDTTERLRCALTNYLANDGSRLNQQDDQLRNLYEQELFTLCGLSQITDFLEYEFSKCSIIQAARHLNNWTVSLAYTGNGIASKQAFQNSITKALTQGASLKLLTCDYKGQTDNFSAKQSYLAQITHVKTTARTTSCASAPLLASDMNTTLIVEQSASGVCLHITGGAADAPYIACCIRRTDHLNALRKDFDAALKTADALFAKPETTTPRFISSKMLTFYRNTNDIFVASDGLNPIFMSKNAFARFLDIKGYESPEAAWRMDAFCEAQQDIEQKLQQGKIYHEMTTALDAACVSTKHLVATNGPTFFDAQFCDLATALDILHGYLRFASLYDGFGARFTNPSTEMSEGLWMINSNNPNEGDNSTRSAHMTGEQADTGGIIICRRKDGYRNLYSDDVELTCIATTAFKKAWKSIRYRFFADGRTISSNDDSGMTDMSRNVFFIRERIRYLEKLIEGE